MFPWYRSACTGRDPLHPARSMMYNTRVQKRRRAYIISWRATAAASPLQNDQNRTAPNFPRAFAFYTRSRNRRRRPGGDPRGTLGVRVTDGVWTGAGERSFPPGELRGRYCPAVAATRAPGRTPAFAHQLRRRVFICCRSDPVTWTVSSAIRRRRRRVFRCRDAPTRGRRRPVADFPTARVRRIAMISRRSCPTRLKIRTDVRFRPKSFSPRLGTIALVGLCSTLFFFHSRSTGGRRAKTFLLPVFNAGLHLPGEFGSGSCVGFLDYNGFLKHNLEIPST